MQPEGKEGILPVLKGLDEDDFLFCCLCFCSAFMEDMNNTWKAFIQR
jgi:hypothetical protein